MTASDQKTIDTPKFALRELELGILETYVKPGAVIEVADAWEIKKYNLELTGGQPYCVLVISGHLASISKGAREVVASQEYVKRTLAKALMVESLGHRIVGNFYMTVNKPYIRTKLFTDKKEAIDWLRKQLALNV